MKKYWWSRTKNMTRLFDKFLLCVSYYNLHEMWIDWASVEIWTESNRLHRWTLAQKKSGVSQVLIERGFFFTSSTSKEHLCKSGGKCEILSVLLVCTFMQMSCDVWHFPQYHTRNKSSSSLSYHHQEQKHVGLDTDTDIGIMLLLCWFPWLYSTLPVLVPV